MSVVAAFSESAQCGYSRTARIFDSLPEIPF
jgi:hypothetical protein